MRKEIQIDIKDNDNNLKFKIKQMPATVAERFMTKTLLLLGRTGTLEALGINDSKTFDRVKNKEIDIANVLKALSNLDYNEVEPLFNELLQCCTRITDSGAELRCTPDVVDGFIENPITLYKLKLEAGKLNFSFFAKGVNSPNGTEKKEIQNMHNTKIQVIE